MDRFGEILKWILDPANLTAISTVIIAAFTIVLAAVGYCQARLIRKSIDLARKEFISAHPPKLRIRYIHLTSGDENVEVGFTVENTGGSDATVTQSMIGLQNYKAPLPCPPLSSISSGAISWMESNLASVKHSFSQCPTIWKSLRPLERDDFRLVHNLPV